MKNQQQMAQEELRRALAMRFHHCFSNKQPGEGLDDVLSRVMESMTGKGADDIESVAVLVSTKGSEHSLGAIMRGDEVMVRYKGPQGTVELGVV